MSLREMPVSDVMTTDVLTFTPDQNVQDAMQQLVARGVDAGPVVDDAGAVVGMLSTGDLIVEEARVHFPTVVNFLGVNVTWPFEHHELDDTMAKALGASVGEVMTAAAVTIDAVGLGRGRGHADARQRSVPAAGGRRTAGWSGLIARGDIVQGHRRRAPARASRPRCAPPGPRSTWRPSPTTWRCCASWWPRPSCARWSRPTATATGPSPSARRRSTPEPPGWGWRWSRKGPCCARRASRPRSSCCPSPAPPTSPPRCATALQLSVYTAGGIEAVADAARAAGTVVPVHLKVNTGMNRVGAEPDDIATLAKEIARRPELDLEALWTHCAVADEPGNPFTDEQLDRFDQVAAELAVAGHRPPDAPRGQHGGGHRPPSQPLRPGPGRHRHLRHQPGAGARRAGRPAAGADPASRGVDGEAGGGRRARSPTACATASSATRWWPPSPSATPTAFPAGCRWWAARCWSAGRRRPIVGRRHHGPADGRLRRRRRRRGRRGGADRPPGRRDHQRRRRGPRRSTRSPTRSCAASGPGCLGRIVGRPEAGLASRVAAGRPVSPAATARGGRCGRPPCPPPRRRGPGSGRCGRPGWERSRRPTPPRPWP